MPLYDLRCPQCHYILRDVLLKVQEMRDKQTKCPQCATSMEPMTSKVHTQVGISVDGKDRGKVIKEKNEQLKKRHAGYEHETKALKKDIERQIQKKVKRG